MLAGFIIGLYHDTLGPPKQQYLFITDAGIQSAMIGLLTAVLCHMNCTLGRPCHIGGMAYVIIPTGPLGFQVTTTDAGASHLIADFASLTEAEAFVASMRQIDAGLTSLIAPKEPC